MCGIVGIVCRDGRTSPDLLVLEKMTASLNHRGPDDGGIYINGPVGLGHRRLAVIDLAGGRQPMVKTASNRALVYNGEIYNFRELRRALDDRSDVFFETASDTEVLLNLASIAEFQWLESLNGMFAFALWEENTRTLLLARDRLGIKPLYYTQVDDEFLFASEVRALLLHPKVAPVVNVARIPEYLAFRSICGPETMLKGIYELLPGHVLVFRQKAFEGKLAKFWLEGKGKTVRDFVDPGMRFEDQFERLLLDSVRFRLISDVPVGTYNSGGVDSSLVTSMARSLTEGELHTFSVGFEETDHDESEFAQILAKRLGTHHHTLMINEQQYLDSYEDAVVSLEEPLNHAHTVPLLQLSKFAKQYVTVVLTGEGADELFGGYPRFHIPVLAQSLRVLPLFLTRRGLQVAGSIGSRKIVKLLENADDCVEAVVENSRFTPGRDFEAVCPGSHPFAERLAVYEQAERRADSILGRMLYFDQRTYLPALLNRLDKVSMAAAIECRVPYLDYRLVEWSALLPASLKLRVGWDNKIIVKRVARRWVPREIVSRKKVGFGVPVSRWLRNPRGLGRYLDLLTDTTFRTRGYCDHRVVEGLIHEHLQGDLDHSEILWGLVNMEMWWRLAVDSWRQQTVRKEPAASLCASGLLPHTA